MTDPQRPQGNDTVEAEVRVLDEQPDPKPEVDTPAPRFGDALRRWFGRGSADAKELAGAVRSEAAIANEQVQTYVRKEPVKAVFFAAAAGALITAIMASGRRRGRHG